MLAACLLTAVLVLHVVTLTSAPTVFGDEAWIGSKLRSLMAGDGFRAQMAADYEIYDVGTDYWTARIGSLPQVIGALVGPETFTFGRIVSFLTSLVALAVFWLGLRRLHGPVAATFGTAALATTWAFFTASHWIRFDPMGFLVAAAVLAILLAGPPSTRACLGLGLMLGLSSDWAYPLLAVVPGVALLALWEPGGRWRRLGALAAGVGIGLAVFYALHILPNPDAAQEQYDEHYRASYGDGTPLLQVVEDRSLQPLIDEFERYEILLNSPFRPSVITLLIGLIAAVIVMLRLRGGGRRGLAVAGFVALALGVVALLVHHLDLYLDHPGLLEAIPYVLFAVLGLAVGGIAWVFLRDRPRYPRHAVAAILLVSQLVGLGLIQDFKFGVSSNWGIVYAIAAVIAAAELLVPLARRQVAVAGVMTALTFAGATYMLESEADAPAQPAVDDEVGRIAREVVPPGRTVMGEFVYWWLYRDERYRTNTTIWFLQYNNPEYDFERAFHEVNPDYVLLDDLWLSRYPFAGDRWSAADFWPNEAPHDPREEAWLMRLLRAEYRPVRRVEFEGQQLVFWERKDLPMLPG